MPGIYNGSKGPVAIDNMLYTHLRNAAEKLRRMGDPSRVGELANMDARLADLEAQYRAEHPEA